ncbi:MAG: O-antigen ligase family protein [Eubacterium sp.]
MKIKKFSIFCYIAAICFTVGSSAFLKNINVVALVVDAIEAMIVAYCGTHIILNKRFSIYTFLVVLFYVFLGISTFLGSQQYTTFIVYSVQAIAVTVFIQWAIKKNPIDTIRILRNVLFIFLLINMVLMLAIPEGFGEYNDRSVYYLLGIRIAFTPFIITELYLSLLYDIYKKNKIISPVTIASIIVGYITVIDANVATGIVTITVFLALYLIFINKNQIFNFVTFIIIYAIVFVAIVIYNVQYHIPFLSYFLIEVLERDLSFDNRTTIWATAIEHFLENPILGWGITGGGGIAVRFEYNTRVISAHNQILNVLSEGGVVSFALFAAMSFETGRMINKVRKTKIGKLTMCAMVSFFLIMLTEVQMTKALLFIIFSFGANIIMLLDKNELNELNMKVE